MNLTDSLPMWQDLLALFRRADTCSVDELCAELNGLCLPDGLSMSLQQAVRGDNRPLNAWLFSDDGCIQAERVLPWIAPVLVDGRRCYAWMLGVQAAEQIRLRQLVLDAAPALARDPLVPIPALPPLLLYVDPVAVSSVTGSTDAEGRQQDEFAIFQVGYEDAAPEVSDYAQRMVLNTDVLTAHRTTALRRAAALGVDSALLERIETALRWYALLHIEGHNIGHFVGPWPFDTDKDLHLYQAVEEFRACLAAVPIAAHLGLTEDELDALAVSVFLVRFLTLAAAAFALPQQRPETAREISVGLMFFEQLRVCGAIRWDAKRKTLAITPRLVRMKFVESLREIHDIEGQLSAAELERYAEHLYHVAFPNGQYSPEALAILRHVGDT